MRAISHSLADQHSFMRSSIPCVLLTSTHDTLPTTRACRGCSCTRAYRGRGFGGWVAQKSRVPLTDVGRSQNDARSGCRVRRQSRLSTQSSHKWAKKRRCCASSIATSIGVRRACRGWTYSPGAATPPLKSFQHDETLSVKNGQSITRYSPSKLRGICRDQRATETNFVCSRIRRT